MIGNQLSFYVSGVGAGLLGTLLALTLGWGEEALFAAGVIPLWGVLFVFIFRDRDPKDGIRSAARGPRSASR